MDSLNKALQNVNDANFLNVNGASFLFTIITLALIIGRITYIYIKIKSSDIRKDWAKKRCYPHIIPFAGIIYPHSNKSAFQTTADNFNFCTEGVLESIIKGFTNPIYYGTQIIGELITTLVDNIQSLREKMRSIASNFTSMHSKVINIFVGLLIPLREILTKVKDTLSRSFASTIVSMYSIIGSYYSIMAFLRGFLHSAVSGMYALAAIIIALLAFVFTAPAAIPLLAIFGVVGGLMGTIAYYLADILDESVMMLPKRPSCFCPNTLLRTKDGSEKEMYTIECGDILKNDGRVTSVITIENSDPDDMYYFPKLESYISGSHQMLYNNEWQTVSKLHQKIANNEINNRNLIILKCDGKEHQKYTKPYLYCINTQTGLIRKNGHTFSDWFDIEYDEYEELSEQLSVPISSPRDIHRYLSGGFAPYTNIKLWNNTYKNINQIQIGDILDCGSRVIGLVEIDSHCVNVYQMNIMGTKMVGALNNIICVKKHANVTHISNVKIPNDSSSVSVDVKNTREYFSSSSEEHIAQKNKITSYKNNKQGILMFSDSNSATMGWKNSSGIQLDLSKNNRFVSKTNNVKTTDTVTIDYDRENIHFTPINSSRKNNIFNAFIDFDRQSYDSGIVTANPIFSHYTNNKTLYSEITLHGFRKKLLHRDCGSDSESDSKPMRLYHLITDTGSFIIGGVIVKDYYSCSDFYF